MLKGIEKMDLIRHNNQLVERVHLLERENRGVEVPVSSKTTKLVAHLLALKEEF